VHEEMLDSSELYAQIYSSQLQDERDLHADLAVPQEVKL